MQSSPPRMHLLSLGQLLLAGFGILLLLPVTAGMVLQGVQAAVTGASAEAATSFFSFAAIALALCLLLLPSLVLAFARLSGRPLPALRLRDPFRAATWMLLLWPVFLLIGFFTARVPALSILLLPPLQVLAIGIPIWWVVEAGRRGVAGGSTQRGWGVLGFGLLPGPFVIILAEFFVVALLGAGLVFWVAMQRDLTTQLMDLANQLRAAGEDPAQLMAIVSPLLQQPGVMIGVFAVAALLLPMVEELLKPLGLWLIAGRFSRPAEGFVAGLISGGAFAFAESASLSANISGSSWAGVVIARLGTGLLHAVTTGLVGWGLASAWTEKRYLRLAAMYLLAVLLHGAWNFFGLLLGISTLVPAEGLPLQGAGQADPLMPLALGALAVLLMIILFGMNRSLRTAPLPPPAAGQLAPEIIEDTHPVKTGPQPDAASAPADSPNDEETKEWNT